MWRPVKNSNAWPHLSLRRSRRRGRGGSSRVTAAALAIFGRVKLGLPLPTADIKHPVAIREAAKPDEQCVRRRLHRPSICS